MRFCYFIAAVLMWSCNTTGKKPPAALPEEPKAESSVLSCYQYATEKDTIELRLRVEGNAVTGALRYQLFEKDGNNGTIRGALKGDLLLAAYTFMSEGITSVREVAFKLSGDQVIEGFGEITVSGNRSSFKNPEALQFNGQMALDKVDCAVVHFTP